MGRHVRFFTSRAGQHRGRPRGRAGETAPSRIQPPTTTDILRLCAISRIFFGNTLRNIQANPVILGAATAVRSLSAGANDIGSLGHEGSNGRPLSQAARRFIHRAGFRPMQRDSLYRPLAARRKRVV